MSDNGFHDLADLLTNTRVRTRVSRERLAPSALYDLHYRQAVIACVFGTYIKPDLAGVKRVPDQRMKLLQFVAARPVLLPMVRRWSRERTEPQSDFFARGLRRGFLDDRIHDAVVEYLVAGNVLMRSESNLTEGARGDLLGTLYANAVARNLFAKERHVLAELRKIVITNRMLEGR